MAGFCPLKVGLLILAILKTRFISTYVRVKPGSTLESTLMLCSVNSTTFSRADLGGNIWSGCQVASQGLNIRLTLIASSVMVDVRVDLTDHYHSFRLLFEPRCPQARGAGSGLGAGGRAILTWGR